MGVFDGVNEQIRKRSRVWSEWAKQHAHDIGERGIRHLERQDLLSERKRLVVRVGEYVVHRTVDLDKKSVRVDAEELGEMLDSIRSIDARLTELDDENG
jgi:hypothetical protein